MPWRGRARDAVVPRAFDGRRGKARAWGVMDDDDEDDDDGKGGETGHGGGATTSTSRAARAAVKTGAGRGRDARDGAVVDGATERRASGGGALVGVTFYLDGAFAEGARALRATGESVGGTCALAYARDAGITHYVVDDFGCMEDAARERYRTGRCGGMKCVRGEWIRASAREGRAAAEESYAPRGTPRGTPRKRGAWRRGDVTEVDLVDLIVDTAWNGTGGVSTQEQMRETWTIRVVFERVERALEDERVKDSEVRKMSARSYNALKAVVDERWIAPVSASEALVDIQGTRNLEKRNNLAPSQGSPADVAQALEWIMVDTQGVNVRASMHDVRDDGWNPTWLRERASSESVGVMTRRASQEAAAAAVASQSEQDLRTLSQLSNIEPEVFEALDPQTRYEWSKARAEREKQRIDRLRAEQSAVFQLLRAGSSGKNVTKATAKKPRLATPTERSPAKKFPVKKSNVSQMPITVYTSPTKEKDAEPSRRSCVGEPVMASTSVHTATLLHAFDRVLSVDGENEVDGRLDVAGEVVRLHIEELARDRRRQEVKAVRGGLENMHSDHPKWVAIRRKILDSTKHLL